MNTPVFSIGKMICGILCIVLAVYDLPLQAQGAQKISYQATVRNQDGHLLKNQNISAHINIKQGSASGATVYAETQVAATNGMGLLHYTIGGGVPVSGSFASINWGEGPYFLTTSTDLSGGNNYTVEGTSELLSVPYARYAVQQGDTIPVYHPGFRLEINNQTISRKDTVNNFVAGSGIVISGQTISLVQNPEPTYSVGDTAQGGIVFYVSTSGKHGLVMAMQDQMTDASWYVAHDSVSNPSKHNTFGQQFSNWRLPTIHELSMLYSFFEPTNIGGLSITDLYWSETANSSLSARSQAFWIPGNQYLGAKTATKRVRAIRSF